ncbi:hypothetical protein BCV70DRAFT_84254 [Testicularia cyperi]|uniref:Uncharacterized protein n=1 Tax=Testicularia cyperi TaxID=1882483 RepID=A0A317XRF6_9BASI|nr:hypothetical protein BCV70DRAFT_84254 [Testicularia cyperi]
MTGCLRPAQLEHRAPRRPWLERRPIHTTQQQQQQQQQQAQAQIQSLALTGRTGETCTSPHTRRCWRLLLYRGQTILSLTLRSRLAIFTSSHFELCLPGQVADMSFSILIVVL